ncbi:unnamed protein product [Malus baccata var. baccata]
MQLVVSYARLKLAFVHQFGLHIGTACRILKPELWLVLVIILPVHVGVRVGVHVRVPFPLYPNPLTLLYLAKGVSPSACDEVAVRYPNGGSTVFYHSNFRPSAIGRGISDDQCQWLLRAVVELSLFGGPDDPEFNLFRGCLWKECGIEVDVENGSSKNDSTCASCAQD